MEMLSDHTLEGWYEGYVLSGRHSFFATCETFAHVIDSLFNQHAKWLSICDDTNVIVCDKQIDCRNYAYTYGIDKPDVADWTWPC